MTNKERAKIYSEAAQLLLSKRDNYCCSAIARIVFGDNLEWRKVSQFKFPELFMFKFRCERPNSLFGWWINYDDINTRKARILALLLSEQIALNP